MQPGRRALLLDDTLRGAAWCRAYSVLVDEWLAQLFDQAVGSAPGPMALVAVGGYGRSELCPTSDIDVMLVYGRGAAAQATAERLWYPIWDSGLRLGHSVCTVSEAMQLAASDLDTATALLSARHLVGESSLSRQLAKLARTQWRRHAKRWLSDLADSVEARHARAGEVAFLLEPDLKEGRGGLRDVHALRWAELGWPGLLADDEASLNAGYSVLLDARVELQRHAGRATNVLGLEEQPAVAEALGVGDPDNLMIQVAGAASVIAWASDDSWRRVRKRLVPPFRRVRSRAQVVGPGIVIMDGEVNLEPGADVATDPLLPLTVAVLAANHQAVVSRRALQRLSDSPPLPEPWPRAARALLVELLRAGAGAIPVIESLDQHGLWRRVLPEWEAVRSRPQHNAYHRFTVDRHLLETVAEAAPLAEHTSRPDLLVVGALLHDLGKGRDRDHSVVGVELTEAITTRMGFPAADISTLVFLIRHHLLLPEAATRRDLDDPETIAGIAGTVGTLERLWLLAALSEADSRATGPAAWGSWRRDLLEVLVRRVAEKLDGQDPSATAVRSPTPQQLELLRQPGRFVRAGHNVVTVVADDRPGLFSRIAGVLAAHGLDVLAASAHSSDDGRALSEFRVVDSMRRDTPWQRVVADLEQALDGRLAVNARIADRARVYGRSRPAYTRLASTSVSFDNATSSNATVIDVHAADRTGLLYLITRAMAELDLDIRSARVETFGAQAVDSFYVRDLNSAKILDRDGLVEIERAILHSLGDGLS